MGNLPILGVGLVGLPRRFGLVLVPVHVMVGQAIVLRQQSGLQILVLTPQLLILFPKVKKVNFSTLRIKGTITIKRDYIHLVTFHPKTNCKKKMNDNSRRNIH